MFKFNQQYQQGYLALFVIAIVSVAILLAVNEINEDVKNYNNGYREVKDERVNNSL